MDLALEPLLHDIDPGTGLCRHCRMTVQQCLAGPPSNTCPRPRPVLTHEERWRARLKRTIDGKP